MKKTVAILFGGSSSEHEISCISAAAIAENLDSNKYNILMLGITKDGRWFLYSGSTESIRTGTWASDTAACRHAFLSPDTSVHGIVAESPDGFESIRIDCIIPALHGKNAEDGTMQGLLHLSGIPYVGSPTLASACCMDKAVTHTLLASWNIKQAHFLWFFAENYSGDGRKKIQCKIDARLGWPIFLKPANAGSSVGISKVKSAKEMDAAVALAALQDSKIIVEEAVTGQEIECAVLGNECPQASIVGEIGSNAEFYDYDDKYKNGTSTLYIPAHLEESVAEELRHIACRAYRLLGCTGLARVDFFVRNGKEILLNELNTLPGFTSISMYPKLWEACGKPIGQLLDELISLAEERKRYI
ncbi:MAG TPA: D-alanine--D-alanine ligase A [Ruminococcaceae bacterium]|jgi:D-alanine-D-alanine ligase|nr:D-alanine--D-alanine ligase [Oscillospiraceae bacterium]HCA71756.1 D-alanine--D-alanine ligase A [Oscillospiraceae bacterium]HCC02750.1 D-alanine--D-alanine ligase A [Oscillospiraceae bacterium]